MWTSVHTPLCCGREHTDANISCGSAPLNYPTRTTCRHSNMSATWHRATDLVLWLFIDTAHKTQHNILHWFAIVESNWLHYSFNILLAPVTNSSEKICLAVSKGFWKIANSCHGDFVCYYQEVVWKTFLTNIEKLTSDTMPLVLSLTLTKISKPGNYVGRTEMTDSLLTCDDIHDIASVRTCGLIIWTLPMTLTLEQ